jgi:TolA-binding protein
VAEDDKEEKLPPRVEKALAAARRQAKGDRNKGTRGGRWLAFIPVTIGVLLFALVMPRSTEPRDIPMPAVDGAALKKVTDADIARAARARSSRLPDDVLALGTAIRQLNRAQTDSKPEEAESAVAQARVTVDDAKRALKKESLEDVLTLRAVQLDEFLAEVAKFESTGQESKELTDLGGTFVARMRDATWIDGSRVLLDKAQRRAAYKLVWNAVAGVSGPEFDLSVDEERVLYTLYIAHPHVPDSRLPTVRAELAQAHDEGACSTAHANERRLVEMWRAEKIQKLAILDPSYPTDYALGVAYYRAGRYEQSIDAFRRWIDKHPEGAYALRARNHLRAALAAYGAI